MQVTDLLRDVIYGGHRITNFEMETAAIYGLARLSGHRALSLNAILANRLANTFSPDPARAIDLLITYTLERLEDLPDQ